MLTGGFSEVDRAQRVAMAQDEFRAELTDWPPDAVRRLYRAALSGLLAQGRSRRTRSRMRASCATPRRAASSSPPRSRSTTTARRHRTDGAGAGPSAPALDRSRAPARSPAPTSSMRRSSRPPTGSRSTRSRSRATSPTTTTRSAAPTRIADTIEKALSGEIRLPDVVAKRARRRSAAQGLRDRAGGASSTISGRTATP